LSIDWRLISMCEHSGIHIKNIHEKK